MKFVNPNFWQGRRVFLTGHTGFKGSWLSLWLQTMGAEVFGFALPPNTAPSLFIEANLEQGMTSILGDIRDFVSVKAALEKARPEVVIHMAAQPLVRLSYKQPIETYATNVMGTVHLLEASRQIDGVKSIVCVTSDKCYENREIHRGYREDEPMGGYDPYSSSKGCAELVTSAYRRSYMVASGIGLASARAGNVIGGGDWSDDRLIPDILRAFEQNVSVLIRHPKAIRPWQHVLDPLAGYLMLAERLHTDGQIYAEGWNFGPKAVDARSVSWIVEKMADLWGDGVRWKFEDSSQWHEALALELDISKAIERLHWFPRWDLNRALKSTLNWHKAWRNKQDMRDFTCLQVKEYMASVLPSDLE